MRHRYRFLSFEFIHLSQTFSDNPTYKCMTLCKIIYEKKRRELHICQLYLLSRRCLTAQYAIDNSKGKQVENCI